MSLTIDIRAENSFFSVVIKIKPVFPIAHVAHRAINIKTSSLMIVVEGNELTMKKKCEALVRLQEHRISMCIYTLRYIDLFTQEF